MQKKYQKWEKFFRSKDLNTFETSNARNRCKDYIIKKKKPETIISDTSLFSRGNYCKGQISKEAAQ